MKWQSTPIFLPGKSHEQRSLAGYSPWGSQRIRHTEMGIRLERAKSGESGLWFQKENSAKKLKLTKNLSLLTNESALFFFLREKKLWSKLKKKCWILLEPFSVGEYFCLAFTNCMMHLRCTSTDIKKWLRIISNLVAENLKCFQRNKALFLNNGNSISITKSMQMFQKKMLLKPRNNDVC